MDQAYYDNIQRQAAQNGNYNPGFTNSAYGAATSMYPQWGGSGYSSIAPQIGSMTSQNKLNTQGLEALRSRALQAPGTQSPWAKLQLQSQELGQNQLAGDAAKLANTSTQQAMSSLARSGGLTSGARERLAMQGANQSALSRQGVFGQGMQDKLNIGLQDEQQRLAALTALPQLESQAVQTRTAAQSPYFAALSSDRDAYMGGKQAENAFNLGRYGELMKAYGSDQQANAATQAANRTLWDYLGF